MKRFTFLIVFLLFYISFIYSFSIDKMGISLSSSGRQSRDTLVVTNDGDAPIGVVAKIFERKTDIDGKEINEPVIKDNMPFILYPSQIVVVPGQSKALRVQYIGGNEVKTEMSYRLLIKEIPIGKPSGNGGTSVNLALAYKSSLYVLPNKSLDKNIDVVSTSFIELKGESYIKILLKNKSNVHSIINKDYSSIVFKWDNKEEDRITLGKDFTINVLADTEQFILIPWNYEFSNELPDECYLK